MFSRIVQSRANTFWKNKFILDFDWSCFHFVFSRYPQITYFSKGAGGVFDDCFGVKEFNIHQSDLKNVNPPPFGCAVFGSVIMHS